MPTFLPLSPAELCKAIVTIKHPGQPEPAGYVCTLCRSGLASRFCALPGFRPCLGESCLVGHDAGVSWQEHGGVFTSVMRLLGFKMPMIGISLFLLSQRLWVSLPTPLMLTLSACLRATSFQDHKPSRERLSSSFRRDSHPS